MPPARRSTRNVSTTAARESAHPYARANKPASSTSTRPSASIARPANGKTSLRLTVKAAPSKLRQATSGSQISAQIPPNPYADNASESDATPGPVVRTARSTRNPRTVVEPESEEEDESEDEEDEPAEEDEELEGEEQDEDPQSEDHELEDAEDSEEDAEGDEDEEMDDAEDDHPPPPIIKTTNPLGRSKPNVTVTAPPEGTLQSVEDKEMDDEEEEELSSLDSNENDEEDDEEDDSTSSSDEDGSRSATPDLSKLTRRQRGLYEEADASLMALSNEAQKKKHLTAEEHAMRRAEMARRRKNLSEKRNEEEKVRHHHPLTTSKLSLTNYIFCVADGHNQQTPQKTRAEAPHARRDPGRPAGGVPGHAGRRGGRGGEGGSAVCALDLLPTRQSTGGAG